MEVDTLAMIMHGAHLWTRTGEQGLPHRLRVFSFIYYCHDEEYSSSHLVTVGLTVGGFFVFVEMIVCKDANLIRDLADFICGSSSMTSLVWIVPVFPIFFMIWLPIVYSDKFISSEYLGFSYTMEEMTTFYTHSSFRTPSSPRNSRPCPPVTQLYLSVDAADPDTLAEIDRPYVGKTNAWRRLNESLSILSTL
ncbi:hypothetical protein ADUPG1_008385 [Aduncisulcus paluster]|uniref:Uncharacterized protein n=1 Tax=Aduncisulcus paluster TaxID=2918883 RepID=A0ABQ5KRS6_9EUKA|nr:hypothetical protein ADUPG1_008385 [Aduncisulcus paluster]